MKRANRVLESIYWHFHEEAPASISAIVTYAAQSPRLEFGNYATSNHAESVRIYRAESRRITKQWHDVVSATRACALERATNNDLEEASTRAYSGRLSLARVGDGYEVEYCTGQYWPTEYRAACAAVLREAARIAHARQFPNE